MARKIVITSGKGGVGKTTICANLGNFLAWQGYKVAVVDLDIGLNNLDVALNVENKVVFDIYDVVCNRCRARQALIQDGHNPYLFLLPSNNASCKISKNELGNIIKELEDFFDYILLDCPAGIEDGFHRAISNADEAIVVVTPHLSSIRDADKVISITKNYGINEIYCVINRVRGDLILERESLSVEDVFELLKIKVLGVIPEDDAILNDTFKIYRKPQTKIYRAFSLMSENLINGTTKIYDCTIKYRGIFGIVKRKIKRSV